MSSNMQPGETCAHCGHTEPVLGRHGKLRVQATINLGGVCVRCGTTESLEIDHIAGGRLDEAKAGRRATEHAVREAAAGRTANLQLLCTTCHRAKTNADRAAGRAAWAPPG
jgi:5-methylcytosine-specific restriction endonuclease McrA